MSVGGLINKHGRTVTIAARATATDAAGGIVSTFTSTTNVTGWLQPLSARESEMYGADREQTPYRVFFEAGVTVDNTMRLTVSIDSQTRTLEILGVERPGEMVSGPMRRIEVIAQETVPRT